MNDSSQSPFPNENNYMIAPFWTDNAKAVGTISYEVHNATSGGSLLSEVSSFISQREGVEFSGNWMLLIDWREISPVSSSEVRV